MGSLASKLKSDRQQFSNHLTEFMVALKTQPPAGSQTHIQTPGKISSSNSSMTTQITPHITHSLPYNASGSNSSTTHRPPIPNHIPIYTTTPAHTLSTPLPSQAMNIPPYVPQFTHPDITKPYPFTRPNYTIMNPPSNPHQQFTQMGLSNIHMGTYSPYSELTSPRLGVPSHYKFPKVDFPKFDETNSRGWLIKAEKFFLLNPIMDSHTRVVLGPEVS